LNRAKLLQYSQNRGDDFEDPKGRPVCFHMPRDAIPAWYRLWLCICVSVSLSTQQSTDTSVFVFALFLVNFLCTCLFYFVLL